MKRRAKWLLFCAGVVVSLIGTGLGYFMIKYPDVAGGPPRLEVTSTPELLARGEYLSRHVTVCIDCHSTREWNFYAGPMVPSSEGGGGERFPEEAGFPGTFYAGNITPAGIGNWSDGELARAITSGVDPDGRAMYTVMPFDLYRHLCERDLHAVIAYIRTLKPIQKTGEKSESAMLDRLRVRMLPAPPDPWPCPETGLAAGKYLTTVGGCIGCHTPTRNGRRLEGKDFIGGVDFVMPTGGIVRSTNLTPDRDTGIGDWTKDAFIDRFREYADAEATRVPVKHGTVNTVMPWIMYAGMTDRDLGTIYDYLQTVKPTFNRVARFSKP